MLYWALECLEIRHGTLSWSTTSWLERL